MGHLVRATSEFLKGRRTIANDRNKFLNSLFSEHSGRDIYHWKSRFPLDFRISDSSKTVDRNRAVRRTRSIRSANHRLSTPQNRETPREREIIKHGSPLKRPRVGIGFTCDLLVTDGQNQSKGTLSGNTGKARRRLLHIDGDGFGAARVPSQPPPPFTRITQE